jgi:RNA polymerase sigma-70 factor (ECF subfamily)
MCNPAATTRARDERSEPADDRALVAALKARDPRAPRWLVERFQAVVHGLCRRMLGHEHDAEDVAQETFLRALRGMASFDSDRPLRPWLLGIAANRCRTALGRRARRPRLAELRDDEPDTRPVATGELGEELERALGRLRPDYRLVFVLYHEQEQSYEEIAVALGRPIGTIKTWLHRARAELADHLGRRGLTE